jgi:flagella basal body P-ring formation protein FlgA
MGYTNYRHQAGILDIRDQARNLQNLLSTQAMLIASTGNIDMKITNSVRYSYIPYWLQRIMTGSGIPWAAIVALLLGTGLALPAAASETATPHFLEHIRQQVHGFLLEKIGQDNKNTQIELGGLDDWLQLPRCTDALDIFLPYSGDIQGDTTVGVRCHQPQAWKIYVTARIKLMQPVLVASRTLPRGEILSADDFKAVVQDIYQLHGGYITDSKEVIGKSLKRPLYVGLALTPNVLETPDTIKRGQQVDVIARAGQLQVRGRGVALSHGKPGQMIRVRNLSSKRIVTGTVTYEGNVRINL